MYTASFNAKNSAITHTAYIYIYVCVCVCVRVYVCYVLLSQKTVP